MPLSEHEERILAEIERGLVAEDPKFVARARKATRTETPRGRLRWAVAGFLLGLVSLLGLTFHAAFGYAGIALMFLSVLTGARILSAAAGKGSEDLVSRFRRTFSGDE